MKFFISYSRSVEDRVQDIITSLRDDGEEVWWNHDLRPGDDWWASILTHIENCDVCIFFISEKSVVSEYCLAELRYALARNRLVMPIVMDTPITYTIPPEIMTGRVQYEIFSGSADHLKHRIRTTYQRADWNLYKPRYAARPPEPNTGSSDLVDRLENAIKLANEGHFDEAIKTFNNVARNHYQEFGEFCHQWIDKIGRYREAANLAGRVGMKKLAEPKWAAFVKLYADDEWFDPLDVQGKLSGNGARPVVEAPASVPPAEKGMTAEEYFNRALSHPAHDSKIVDYTEAIRLEAGNANIYNNRGNSYKAEGEIDRALEDYNEAIRLNPQYTLAYNNRGLLYCSLQEYDLALEDYNEAIRLNPRFAAVYDNRGKLYYDRKEYDRALADYNEAIRLDPQFAEVYNKRGRIYCEIKNDNNRALADYNEAIRLDPQFAEIYNSRGILYFERKEYDRALADYNEAIRLDPQLSFAYSNRGNLFLVRKEYDRALADYNEAIRLNPQFAGFYANRGELYYEQEDYERAIDDYETALRLDPDVPDAANNRQLAIDAKKKQQGR